MWGKTMGSKSPEERYYELLKDFVADKGEKALSMVADLSRELIRDEVPLEDIAELHHHALSGLAQEFPEMTVREASGMLVQPLMEMLMAYALAFREQLEYRRKTEEILRRSSDELERLVEKRTAALSRANQELEGEITRRKQVEGALQKANEELEHRVEVRTRELRESELRIRSIFDALEESVLTITPDGIVEDINPATERIFGYTKDELVGHSTDLLHVDHERYLEFERRIKQAFDWGESAVFEFHAKRREGKIFPTEHSVSLLTGDDGGPIGIVSVVRDITDRKLAEEALRESEIRYRSLFNDSRDGVYVTTRDGRLVEANQAFLDLFGYTREEMMAMAIRDTYLNPADRARFKEDIEQTGSVRDYELKLRRKDGSEIECLVTSSVKRADDGSIIGYQGIIRDVTERKRLEQQLLQAQKMESLGTLAGGIAHDFNNLLTVILGYAELLLVDREKSNPGFADIQIISSAARRGADLVRRILTFSRHIETRRRPIDLNHELKHAEKLLTRTVPKMIKIELHLEEDLKRINGDPAQVEQALLNLAVNAQHAMPDGGKLTIKTENVTLDEDYCKGVPELEPGQHVLLAVSDTGHGMEKEILDHIFEPFFTTKKTGEGTGLGLSMVYGIVKNHDGHIACYSQPGEGTVFNIYLPVAQTEELSDMETAREVLRFGTETILLVDDEEIIGQLGRRLLSRAGYNVLVAGNGQEALKVYRKKQSDISLIILDLIMPEMGGKQCLDELLKIDPAVKVVVSSGFSPDRPTKDILEKGAKAFVGKPFNADELLKTVRQVLDEG